MSLVGFGGDLAMRLVHAGEGGRGERESAGGETCPCEGGRVWGEGVCWR